MSQVQRVKQSSNDCKFRTTIYLEQELRVKIKIWCARNGTDVTKLIHKLLTDTVDGIEV